VLSSFKIQAGRAKIYSLAPWTILNHPSKNLKKIFQIAQKMREEM